MAPKRKICYTKCCYFIRQISTSVNVLKCETARNPAEWQERQGKQTIPAARKTGVVDDTCSSREKESRRYLQQERRGKQTIPAAGEKGEAGDICSRKVMHALIKCSHIHRALHF
jgi:hypothetical protein